MKGKTAEDKFKNGHNCSQAVFCSFCEDFGCDEKTALSIATGFGGGFGRQGMICGCLSGAAIVRETAVLLQEYISITKQLELFLQKELDF